MVAYAVELSRDADPRQGGGSSGIVSSGNALTFSNPAFTSSRLDTSAARAVFVLTSTNQALASAAPQRRRLARSLLLRKDRSDGCPAGLTGCPSGDNSTECVNLMEGASLSSSGLLTRRRAQPLRHAAHCFALRLTMQAPAATTAPTSSALGASAATRACAGLCACAMLVVRR